MAPRTIGHMQTSCPVIALQ